MVAKGDINFLVRSGLLSQGFYDYFDDFTHFCDFMLSLFAMDSPDISAFDFTYIDLVIAAVYYNHEGLITGRVLEHIFDLISEHRTCSVVTHHPSTIFIHVKSDDLPAVLDLINSVEVGIVECIRQTAMTTRIHLLRPLSTRTARILFGFFGGSMCITGWRYHFFFNEEGCSSSSLLMALLNLCRGTGVYWSHSDDVRNTILTVASCNEGFNQIMESCTTTWIDGYGNRFSYRTTVFRFCLHRDEYVSCDHFPCNANMQ